MLHDVAPGLLLGSLALGAVHGAEPGHGWPIAAAYAFDRANAWVAGAVAGLVIGVGHLVSSLAVVAVFFAVKTSVAIDGLSDPLSVAGVAIGSPIGVVAGVLLILLGVREYRGDGHSHDHGDADDGHAHAHGDADDGHAHAHGDGHAHDHTDHDHDSESSTGRLHADVDLSAGVATDVNDAHEHSGGHGHDEHEHDHGHDHGHDEHEHDHGHDHGHDEHEHDHHTHDDAGDTGLLDRVRGAVPFVGDDGHSHSHAHGHDHGLSADEGLYGIAVSAFVLGFAHEEEFEIIAICAGSTYCLELMLAYAGTVVAVITGLTLVLVAGYERFEDRMERYAQHFPTVSAVVLVVMGVGFLLGLL